RNVASFLVGWGCVLVVLGFAFLGVATGERNGGGVWAAPAAGRNSWRGIIPLQSTAADVARLLSIAGSSSVPASDGPFKVDGGEVTFYYVTADQARLYHAPPSMIGRVFSIYFKRNPPLERVETLPARTFKRCFDDMEKRYYYEVSIDGELAYQVRRSTDEIEFEIYQPVRADIQKLRLNTACVF